MKIHCAAFPMWSARETKLKHKTQLLTANAIISNGIIPQRNTVKRHVASTFVAINIELS